MICGNGPAALSLMPRALAPIAELPVLEVVSAIQWQRSADIDESTNVRFAPTPVTHELISVFVKSYQ
jgi:hypothetical protein